MLASDRRATAGSLISKRDVEKVFRCDEFSAVGIAGVLALGLESHMAGTFGVTGAYVVAITPSLCGAPAVGINLVCSGA